MTFSKAGGLEKLESLKADSPREPHEDGLPSGARPGGKDLVRKNHEAASISWNGRASRCFPRE